MLSPRLADAWLYCVALMPSPAHGIVFGTFITVAIQLNTSCGLKFPPLMRLTIIWGVGRYFHPVFAANCSAIEYTDQKPPAAHAGSFHPLSGLPPPRGDPASVSPVMNCCACEVGAMP